MNGIDRKIAEYPQEAQQIAQQIRQLIHETAREMGIPEVVETLKWNEPTFQCKGGSPFRMDWKEAAPQSFSLFFHCQSLLVETFKTLFPNVFPFQDNRAIILPLGQPIPVQALKQCFTLALRYHSVKHLPLLGA